jgi:hypothetical protein
MGKRQIDPDAYSDEHQYEAEFFAAKHGLTLRVAKVVLYSNGPSRQKCDAAARVFVVAVAEHAKKSQPSPPP